MNTPQSLSENFVQSLDSEKLATLVASGIRALVELRPYIEELWRRFDTLKPGETIHSCSTKKQFCESVLHRDPRTVRYMLAGGNPVSNRKSRAETVSAPDGPVVSKRERLRQAFKAEHPELKDASNSAVNRAIYKTGFCLPPATVLDDRPMPQPERETEDARETAAVNAFLAEGLEKLMRAAYNREHQHSYMDAKRAIYPKSHPTDLHWEEWHRVGLYRTMRSILDDKISKLCASDPKPVRAAQDGGAA